MARAWAPSDNEKATAYLAKALELNPRHADSLLLQCEELLDGEQFEPADKLIDEVLKTNPKHPQGVGPASRYQALERAISRRR